MYSEPGVSSYSQIMWQTVRWMFREAITLRAGTEGYTVHWVLGVEAGKQVHNVAEQIP